MRFSARASIHVGLATLRQFPLRTLLSTLGIVMGTAALVSVLALGDGIESFARDQISQSTGVQAIILTPRTSRRVDGLSVPLDDYPVFSAEHTSSLQARAPRARVSLSRSGAAIFQTDGSTEDRAAFVVGVTGKAPELEAVELSHGRSLSAEEADGSGRLAVISNGLARALAEERKLGQLIGSPLRFQGGEFQIIGIAKPSGPEPTLVAWAPFASTDSILLSARPAATRMVLVADAIESVAEVLDQAEGWVADQFGDASDAVRIETMAGRLRQVEQGMLIFKLLMGTLTGVALVVGGVGIMNVLLASVAERTREIGIRKATGARGRDIMLQFLSESVVISGVGAAIGAALGMGVAFAATAMMRSQTDAVVYAAFTWGTVGVAGLAAIIIGITFGSYPAIRAARLEPIAAIRHD